MDNFKIGDKIRVVRNVTSVNARDSIVGKVFTIRLVIVGSDNFPERGVRYEIGEPFLVYHIEVEPESGYFYNPPFGKFSDDYSYNFQAEVDAIARKAARDREEEAMQSIGDYLTITNSLFCLYPSRYEGDLETISKAIQIHFKGLDPEKAVNEVLSNEDVLFQKCIALLKRYIEYMSN